MATIALSGLGSEDESLIELFKSLEDDGAAGGGAIRGTGTYYSHTLNIGTRNMPADLVFTFLNELDKAITCTLQGCNDDFDAEPVFDLPNAIPLGIGSVTATKDYGTGPDRFQYYRLKAVTADTPTVGGLTAKVKPFWN